MPDAPDAVGLCRTCRHHRVVTTRRGTQFWRCRLADVDSRFARYPHLPVQTCAGYDRLPSGRASGDLSSPDDSHA